MPCNEACSEGDSIYRLRLSNCCLMVLFNQVRVWVSLGSIFVKNPLLAFIGTFFMSFFVIKKQTPVFILQDRIVSKKKAANSVSLFEVLFLTTSINRVCRSLIDDLTPLSHLIVRAISQQFDWMRNGRGNKLDN